jgi:hypothetical protein
MSGFTVVVAACASILAVSSSSAAELPLRFVTADGTWDCKDVAGANTGTVVVAENTYAFIKTDGKLGGYGNLKLMATDTGTPKFVVISGYMKDDLGASGASLTGPRGDTENWTELHLYIALSPDRDKNWYCARARRCSERRSIAEVSNRDTTKHGYSDTCAH